MDLDLRQRCLGLLSTWLRSKVTKLRANGPLGIDHPRIDVWYFAYDLRELLVIIIECLLPFLVNFLLDDMSVLL